MKSTGDSKESIQPAEAAPFLDRFLERFQGDFDNYEQVLSDRQNGLSAGLGGGHEHMHSTIIPVDLGMNLSKGAEDRLLIAAYYTNANPSQIFRLRLYCITSNTEDGSEIKTKIFSLNHEIESLLRRISSQPMTWEISVKDYFSDKNISKESCFKEYESCDVIWKEEHNPTRQNYLFQSTTPSLVEDAFHGLMVNEKTVIDSAMRMGKKILVQDELSLWGDELWINDRGFDPDTGAFIYGNQRGVPYKLRRVTKLSSCSRVVCDKKLEWTLGSMFRTEREYAKKMSSIGEEVPPDTN